MAGDVLAIAVAELGAISERRIERLVNPALSGLPGVPDPARAASNSGLMIAHVTAAALASENKVLCHPASVDSIPTSANKEDHVSMGVTAARKAARVVANTRRILAIELLAACQALEFLQPLTTSRRPPGRAHGKKVRAARGPDRMLAPEIEAVADLVRAESWPRRRPRSAVRWSDDERLLSRRSRCRRRPAPAWPGRRPRVRRRPARGPPPSGRSPWASRRGVALAGAGRAAGRRRQARAPGPRLAQAAVIRGGKSWAGSTTSRRTIHRRASDG